MGRLGRKQIIVFAALSALPVIGLLVIELMPAHALSPVGAACEADVTCESDICVHTADAASTAGVCTTPCKTDSACPRTMTCGETVKRAMFPGVGGPPPIGVERHCLPRAWSK